MNTNKITVIGSVIAIILIITIPTIYKVFKNHEDNLYKVVEDKIIYAAEKCFYDELCTEDKITLRKLYELTDLEKVSDPITKEYYNEESYVIRNGTDFEFKVVE